MSWAAPVGVAGVTSYEVTTSPADTGVQATGDGTPRLMVTGLINGK